MGTGKKSKKRRKPSQQRPVQDMDADFIAYTDGGCIENPGGQGGYGVIIVDNATGVVSEYSEGFRSTTNNRMELTAVIVALKKIPEGSHVVLHSDSQYFINCFSGVWGRHKNQDLFTDLDSASEGKEIELRWVRGHAGDPLNERCDALAAAAMRGEDLKEDVGYAEKQEKAKVFYETVDTYAGEDRMDAMAVKIFVKSDLDMPLAATTRKKFAEIYNVNPSCADSILSFRFAENHAFKDYVALRTGGIDAWSSKSLKELLDGIDRPDDVWNVIRHYLTDHKQRLTALRWYRRGLPLRDSIRKVLVDTEVRQCVESAQNKE